MRHAQTATALQHDVQLPERKTIAPAGQAMARLNRPSNQAAAEVARYIAQMTAEMAGMAGAARLEMLAYFLDMARNEAEMQARAARD